MISIPDTNDEFFQWIKSNREGFIVNSDYASSNSGFPALHGSRCAHFTKDDSDFTKNFKLCSINREEIEEWVRRTDQRTLVSCKDCLSKGYI